jgi:hypothetical protein
MDYTLSHITSNNRLYKWRTGMPGSAATESRLFSPGSAERTVDAACNYHFYVRAREKEMG